MCSTSLEQRNDIRALSPALVTWNVPLVTSPQTLRWPFNENGHSVVRTKIAIVWNAAVASAHASRAGNGSREVHREIIVSALFPKAGGLLHSWSKKTIGDFRSLLEVSVMIGPS